MEFYSKEIQFLKDCKMKVDRGNVFVELGFINN